MKKKKLISQGIIQMEEYIHWFD